MSNSSEEIRAVAEGPNGEGVSSWQAWVLASRPKTLLVALGPIAVGTAVAASEGGSRLGVALMALVGAVLLQLGSNFANDVFDHERGADTDARIGPPRASQLGLLSPTQMRQGMVVVFSLALCVGIGLVGVAGWLVVVVGAASILAAVTYTGGPWPFGYHGLGDPAVFLFFGVIAVVGTDFVQTQRLSSDALMVSLAVGALATATLVVNNVRDRETDLEAGKRTLAVRLGPVLGRAEYAVLVGSAYLLLPVFWWAGERSLWIWLPVLSLPRACRLVDQVCRNHTGPPLNEALAGTAQLGLMYSLLLALGWWL